MAPHSALQLPSLAPSLLGVGEPTKFMDLNALDRPRLDVHPFSSQSKQYAVVLVVASAIIFVTAVAVYECIRVAIQYTFVKDALSKNAQGTSNMDVQKANLIGTIIFAVFCIGSAIIVIPMLLAMSPRV
jgi:hypothetical protein